MGTAGSEMSRPIAIIDREGILPLEVKFKSEAFSLVTIKIMKYMEFKKESERNHVFIASHQSTKYSLQ
jgi:hypothetical protein